MSDVLITGTSRRFGKVAALGCARADHGDSTEWAAVLLDKSSAAIAVGADSPFRAASDESDIAARALNPAGPLADLHEVAGALARVATDRAALCHTRLGGDAALIVRRRSQGNLESFEKSMRTVLELWT